MKKISKVVEVSAGIVVVRPVDNKYKFLLLRSRNYWDFPKGHIELGEDAIDTAIRETNEETTLSSKDLRFKWGKVSKNSDKYKKGTKFAVYFIAETDRNKIDLPVSKELGRPEHDEYRWVSYGEAKKLVNERIGKILDWANGVINV